MNINIQFTMVKTQTKTTFFRYYDKKSGTKIWIDIYNKLTYSTRYVPFTSNHPRYCFTNIPFSFARRICIIVENENVKEKRFKELKITLLGQKYPKLRIEASILRAKEIPLEILRQTKAAKKEDIFPFITYNSNNPNVLPIIKQGFDNFQYSKTMSNIFQRKKFVKSMRQALNLGRLLCRSKFESQHKNHKIKSGKNCVSSTFL